MFRTLKPAVLACVVAGSAAFAQTDGPQSRVIVPDVPGGADPGGCYRADRDLYGPYRLSFCLQRKGFYAVRGGGIVCDGKLTWTTQGRDVRITLKRQSCNRGVAWAEGRITCRPRSALDIILSELFGQRRTDAQGRVIVPDVPKVKSFRCTYQPTVRGEPARSFVANRMK